MSWNLLNFVLVILLWSNRQPEKRSEYQTLVLNDWPFSNALAVSLFRRCARLRLCAHDFHCSIQKRRGKLGRNISFNESHVLFCYRQIMIKIENRKTLLSASKNKDHILMTFFFHLWPWNSCCGYGNMKLKYCEKGSVSFKDLKKLEMINDVRLNKKEKRGGGHQR